MTFILAKISLKAIHVQNRNLGASTISKNNKVLLNTDKHTCNVWFVDTRSLFSLHVLWCYDYEDVLTNTSNEHFKHVKVKQSPIPMQQITVCVAISYMVSFLQCISFI